MGPGTRGKRRRRLDGASGYFGGPHKIPSRSRAEHRRDGTVKLPFLQGCGSLTLAPFFSRCVGILMSASKSAQRCGPSPGASRRPPPFGGRLSMAIRDDRFREIRGRLANEGHPPRPASGRSFLRSLFRRPRTGAGPRHAAPPARRIATTATGPGNSIRSCSSSRPGRGSGGADNARTRAPA